MLKLDFDPFGYMLGTNWCIMGTLWVHYGCIMGEIWVKYDITM